ncbi:hypothetical protein [Neobacillus cucumis]|uniref:Uncharacterized protein n=1 Tax=Neobacillus cucumis TaxID=1740721 RepID=A0A2N5HA40_9BACI|nr:hypothetical protein [Neobacillus cucumis]PLS02396.1 hypothetical protein CVD27_19770 [Neobacillus cucumis]
MKDNEKLIDLERKIRSFPEPDYDKKFSKETQDIIHENLLQFASSYEKKKKGRAIMKKMTVGLVSVAAVVLFAILTIPITKDSPSSHHSNKQGQQSKEPITKDENKPANDKESNNQNKPADDKESNNQNKPADDKESNNQNNPATDTIIYENTEYGFTFTLPKSWEGYQIVTDTWEGISTDQNTVIEKGPILLIRHPDWTAEKPRQDIPIMVFTHDQWSSLQKEEYHIGAAPIGPTMLGQNDEYVFALPARYNYAFLEGYQEVEKILENNPMETK